LKGDGQVIGGPLLPSSPGFSASTTKSTFALDDANKLLDANWSRVSADEYRKTRHDALIKEMGEMASGTLAALVATSTTSAVTSTEQSLESLVQNRLNEEIQAAQTFYRKDKGGNILTLNIVTADTPEYKQVAELIAGSWQEIGVRTTVELVPSKDIPRQVLKERDYDVLLYGLIVGSDPDQYPFWHSSQINFPGLNLSRYSNRTVDDLLVKARATTDVSAVSSLYEKIQDQIISDRPTIFLYTPTYTYATNDRMYGIVDNPVYQPADRFNLAASWYMKTKGQWKVR
jgi:ABC-type transport system substrate-binding protein